MRVWGLDLALELVELPQARQVMPEHLLSDSN